VGDGLKMNNLALTLAIEKLWTEYVRPLLHTKCTKCYIPLLHHTKCKV
jgi:hypothetical protein